MALSELPAEKQVTCDSLELCQSTSVKVVRAAVILMLHNFGV